MDDWVKLKEPIHINNDGHLDTENRHLVIKDAINDDHATSKKQLHDLETRSKQQIVASINTLKTEIQTMIQTSITTALNNLRTEIGPGRTRRILCLLCKKICQR